MNYSTFLEIIKYLYTDTANVNLETAIELFEAADKFCIERLRLICEETISNSITVQNAP